MSIRAATTLIVVRIRGGQLGAEVRASAGTSPAGSEGGRVRMCTVWERSSL